MNRLSLTEQTRRENVRYHRGALSKILDDLDDDGIVGRLESLITEMRSDGFADVAFLATQALPLLRKAIGDLERAKGRVGG